MDPAHPASGEDGAQWHPGSQGDWVPHCVHREGHTAGQISAERRYVCVPGLFTVTGDV